MRQLTAFIHKECMELSRTSKLLILLIVSVVFGVMNPGIAKLTPMIMKMAAGSLEGTGLVITDVEIDAMTSWTQFYKNIPMMLIVFVLLFSSIMVTEYQKGTLINMITKGLSRWKIVTAKLFVMLLLWTTCYVLCYGITYFYNEYFWDNGIAYHLFPAAFYYYLFGAWVIALLMLMSVLFSSGPAVMVSTGGVVLAVYFASMLPDIRKYLPLQLSEGMNLLTGVAKPTDCVGAVVVTCILIILQIMVAIMCFNRKNV